MPKTVKELSVERNIDRSTLLKAAQQKRIPAYQSGKTWLIDDESPEFLKWLTSRKRKLLEGDANALDLRSRGSTR